MEDPEIEEYAAAALALAPSRISGFDEMPRDEQAGLVAALAQSLWEQDETPPGQSEAAAALCADIRAKLEDGSAMVMVDNQAELLGLLAGFAEEKRGPRDVQQDENVALVWDGLKTQPAEENGLELLHGLLMPPAERGQRNGMENLGNTCFINVVLQSLLRVDAFVQALRYVAGVLEDEPEAHELEAPLLMALLAVQEQLQSGKAVDTRGVIAAIKDRTFCRGSQVSSHHPWLSLQCSGSAGCACAQEDAHEFLVAVFKQLEAEVHRCYPTAPNVRPMPLARSQR